MKSLKAYKKEQLRYIGSNAIEGSQYFKDEWRFKKGFSFLGKILVTYVLIGDYWIETDDQ